MIKRVTFALVLMTGVVRGACPLPDHECVAASTSLADVQTAVSTAVNGDTVRVPAGSSPWSGTLTIAKGITLVGAGRDSTEFVSTGGTLIVIQPDSTVLSGELMIRVDGITLNGNNIDNAAFGLMRVIGAGVAGPKPFKNLSIINCRFKNNGSSSTAIYLKSGQTRGVIAKNDFDRCNIIVRPFGNDSVTEWTSGVYPFAYGSADNLFFENNTVRWSSSFCGSAPGWTENGQGGRIVIRYNTWDMANAHDSGNCSTFALDTRLEMFDVHGFQNWPFTGSNSPATGSMVEEIYGNTATNIPCNKVIIHRGSWLLAFNNAFSGLCGDPPGSGCDIVAQQYGHNPCSGCSGCNDDVNMDGGLGALDGQVNNVYVWNNNRTPNNTGITNIEPMHSAFVGDGCSIPGEGVSWHNYDAACDDSICTGGGIGRGTSAPTGAADNGSGFWQCSTPGVTTNSVIVQTGHLWKRIGGVWVDYYQPYQHPHPLAGGTPGPTPTPGPPTPTPTATPTPVPGVNHVEGMDATSQCFGSANTGTLAYPSDVTAGRMLGIGGAVWNTIGVPSGVLVTGTGTGCSGTTFAVTLGTGIDGHARSFIGLGAASGSGPCTITVNPSNTSDDFSWSQAEFYVTPSGTVAVDVDGGSSTGAMPTPAAAGQMLDAMTPSANAMILEVGTHSANTIALTATTGFTAIGSNTTASACQPHLFGYKRITTSTSYNATIDYAQPSSGGLPWVLQTYSIKDSGASPTATPGPVLFLIKH